MDARHSADESLRLAAERRARAAYELDVLAARSADLRAHADGLREEVGRGRRALGKLLGSAAWERMLERADGALGRRMPLPPGPVRVDDAGAPQASEELVAAERARMARLARRVRAYEAGLREVTRALAAARARRRGGPRRKPATSHPGASAPAVAADRRGRLRLRFQAPPRGEASLQRLVSAIVPCSDARQAAGAARALRREGLGCELALVAPRRTFGASVAEAIGAAGTPYVLIGTAALEGSGAVNELTEVLESDPRTGAVAAQVVSATTRAASDGGYLFEWSAGAPRPTLARSSPWPAAVGGGCLLLRRSALAGCELARGYRGGLWAIDLSLQLQSRGFAVRVADVVASAARSQPASDGDLELLLHRWGGSLSSLVLRDAVAGGGRWSARAARVFVSGNAARLLGAACEAAGWELVERRAAAPDLLLATDNGTVTATTCSVGVAAPANLGSIDLARGDPAEVAALLRQRLLESLARPSVALHLGERDEQSARSGGDFYLAKALAMELSGRGHHVSIRTAAEDARPARHSADVRITVRGRRPAGTSPGQLNLLWIISHPREVGTTELEDADGVLVASEAYARRVSAQTSTPVWTLLQFADPAVFAGVTPTEDRYEILFAGNWRGVFRRAVWDAHRAGFRVALVGRGWRYLAPEDVIADHVPHDRLGSLYSSAKVLLADHWDDMRDEGFVSNRIFDALACGSFVISDYVSGVKELLPGGVEVYGDAAQLGRQLRRYLADDDARRRVAERGRQLVLQHHTAKVRVDELLVALISAAAASSRPAVRHLAGARTPSAGWRQSFLDAAPSEA